MSGATGENTMNTLMKGSVLAAVLTGTLFAQPQFGEPRDPAAMVQNRVTRLTALLGLSTTQVTQATTIFTDAQTAITPLHTTLSGYRTSMQAAVKSNSTTTIDQLAASIGVTTGQIAAVQNKAEAAFYAILTAAQQTTLGAAGGGGFGGRGGGRPGPGGFGRGPAGQ
jgi:hypothetical protein